MLFTTPRKNFTFLFCFFFKKMQSIYQHIYISLNNASIATIRIYAFHNNTNTTSIGVANIPFFSRNAIYHPPTYIHIYSIEQCLKTIAQLHKNTNIIHIHHLKMPQNNEGIESESKCMNKNSLQERNYTHQEYEKDFNLGQSFFGEKREK